MNTENVIDIPVDEFNLYEKFVHNIILYNFDVACIRHSGIDDYKLEFQHVHYNFTTRKFSIKLRRRDRKSHIFTGSQFVQTIDYKRFAQFINGAFDLDAIIDKYDTSIKPDKIVYSEELKQLDSALFKNPNVVIIYYKENHNNVNGENKLYSVTPGNYYLAIKENNKYRLLTYNYWDRSGTGKLSINQDSRSIEYKIIEWKFTIDNFYPMIESLGKRQLMNLNKGSVIQLYEYDSNSVYNQIIQFLINKDITPDVIDTFFNKRFKFKHSNLCSEIELPGSHKIIITSTPTGNNNYYEQFVSYDDRLTGIIQTNNEEFDPNEFLLNHKIVIPERKVKGSKEFFDLFLNNIK